MKRLSYILLRSHESLCCSSSRNEECAHLPARIGLKTSYIHPKSSTSRARETAVRTTSVFMASMMTVTTSELHGESLTFELAAVVGYSKREAAS